MREYELIYIIQPDATAEREQEIHARIDAAITGGDGQILVREDWGKRKLAYEIDKFQKGHYFLLSFLGNGLFISEVERLLRIDADVLRFLSVLVEENVKDVEGRLVRAKEQRAEQERRQAEREQERARAEASPERSESDEDEGEEE